MILLAGLPTIDASPPVLSDASHRAADRDVEPCNKALVPPGKFCLRCGGLLVSSYTANWERDVTGKPMTLWRCVNCGDCVDHDILANQGKSSGSVRPHPRLPIGPQHTGWPPRVGAGMTR